MLMKQAEQRKEEIGKMSYQKMQYGLGFFLVGFCVFCD